MAWFSTVWIPAYLLFLKVAQPTRQRLRQHVASSPVVNVYDALDGLQQGRPTAAPRELAAADVVVLKPLQRETQIHAALRKTVEARLKVTSPAAIQRHDARLASLGLLVPLHSVSIDQTRLVHLPVYVVLLQRQRSESKQSTESPASQMPASPIP